MTIEDDISFFERVPTLNLLGRQALRILAIGAQTRYVHGGEILSIRRRPTAASSSRPVQHCAAHLRGQQGNRGRAPYLAGRGCVVHAEQARGDRDGARPASVVLIPRELFLKMQDSFPDSARKLRDVFDGRLNQSTQEIHNLRAVLDTYDRR
jgi:hypothetical protein